MFPLEIENLYKSFDGLPVLRGLYLQVPAGSVYGLLGQPGAGKSTLVNVLLGFLKPYKGSARLLGARDPASVRAQIGYMPQRPRMHQRFTAREYLNYLGQFNGGHGATLRERVGAELRAVGLLDAADRMVGTYSKSMLQRLNLAQALLNTPQLLIVDEPTAGLDVSSQREILELLNSVRARGTTIFITTHVVPDLEHLCDRIGVLHGGKVAIELNAESLRAPGRDVTIAVDGLPAALAGRLAALSPAVRCAERSVTLQPNNSALQAQVLRALLDAQVTILSLQTQRRPLEDIFIRIVRGERFELAAPQPSSASSSDFATQQTSATMVQIAPRVDGDNTLLRQLLSTDEQHET